MRSEVLAGRRKSVHVWVGCGAGGPVCTGSRVRLKAGGARARAGRTQNIPDMSVTVEVSKMLSDWSNDFAACRESRGGHTMRSGLAGRQQGVCGATAAQAACTGKARLKAWGTRGAYREHLLHVLDLGRVEAAERLVEHCRVLCRVKGRGHAMRARCGPGGRGWCVWCGGGGAIAECTRSRAHARSARRTSRPCS
jgi:hypothetical protein